MPEKFQEPQTSLAEVWNDVSSWSCMPACGLQEVRHTRRLHWEVAWVVAFGRTCAESLGIFLLGCSRHWICITRLSVLLLVLWRCDVDEPLCSGGASTGSVSFGGVRVRQKLCPVGVAVASLRPGISQEGPQAPRHRTLLAGTSDSCQSGLSIRPSF